MKRARTLRGPQLTALVALHRGHDARAYLSWSIKVLTLRGEPIVEITSFIGRDHFAPLGPPDSLP